MHGVHSFINTACTAFTRPLIPHARRSLVQLSISTDKLSISVMGLHQRILNISITQLAVMDVHQRIFNTSIIQLAVMDVHQRILNTSIIQLAVMDFHQRILNISDMQLALKPSGQIGVSRL